MSEYPTINPAALASLHTIAAGLAADPAYLDRPECPYPTTLVDFLRVFGAKSGVLASETAVSATKSVFSGENGDKWAILEAEAADLYQQLKNFSTEIKVGDVAERMSYFRTATSLLEKIVGINERATGLRSINEFHSTILSIFDGELDGDQRTRIMQRLRHSIDGGLEEKAPA